MQIIQIGNYAPEHSTENHILRALRLNGHDVTPMQENDPATFSGLAHEMWPSNPDIILWTRTGWDWNHVYPGGERQALLDQRLMLRRARSVNVPVVGYHLDIWWGLKREYQIESEPFFEVDLLITADGGHADEWARAGVDHVWFPPAISEGEAEVGRYRSEMAADLAFVGSWQGGYHPESTHRHALIEWLQKNYPNCVFYPKIGQHAVRGRPLQDLYRSVKVVVGDSCFTGTGLANYWSDRIPETLGRGGFLLHPDVPDLEEFFTDGLDLCTWDAWDFDYLGALIESALSHPEQCEEIRRHGRLNVLGAHTYEHRMIELVELLEERNLL